MCKDERKRLEKKLDKIKEDDEESSEDDEGE